MVFSSLEFIFRFLPIFLIFYYITPNQYKNAILLMGSICFYALGEPVYVILILLSVLINFVIGKRIDNCGSREKGKRVWLILALLYNVGMLVAFKYTGFFIENINQWIHFLGIRTGNGLALLPEVNIILPLGISFYTFQITSYIIDVYTGKTEAEESLIRLGAYLCMFPQLIAGPIVTYISIRDQLKNRTHSMRKLEYGLHLFVIGLAAKVLIANRIGGLWREIQTIGFESISTPLAWMGAFAYTLQIYFDFQGYSLMAIGLGKMLGFTLPKNFNYPYTSKSLTEFWQRWHMTLGQWFKEYVYIPLGGNRAGVLKTIRNMFIVWSLTGFWHGANWNFIIWGIIIFLIMTIEKAGLQKWLERFPFFAGLYMLFLIPITWVIFAITSISQLRVYLSRMFPFWGLYEGACVNPDDYIKYAMQYGIFFVIGGLCSTHLLGRWYRRHRSSVLAVFGLFILFWLSIYYLSNASNNPFLYFRF